MVTSVHYNLKHLFAWLLRIGELFIFTVSEFKAWACFVCRHQLASKELVIKQLNAWSADFLLQNDACHFQWPFLSDVKAPHICDRGGWEPSGKARLPDVFCHLFRLPEQAFALMRPLRGLGVLICICFGCSPPASSSSWHLKLARSVLVYTWNAQVTQPCESKLSVSQRRTLKHWPVCWTERSWAARRFCAGRGSRIWQDIMWLLVI